MLSCAATKEKDAGFICKEELLQRDRESNILDW